MLLDSFFLITLVWLFAGFHLAFGYDWLLILFVISDGILALYIFIWYCLMRNQLRGVFKRSFAFPSMSPPIELRDDLFRDSPSPQHSIASLKRMRNSPDEPADWDDLDYGATPKGSRKMFVNLDDTDSLGRVNEMYEDDDDTQDFDDLIIALKTGGQFEPTMDEEKDLDMGDPGDEQYAMRRISIADTHL